MCIRTSSALPARLNPPPPNRRQDDLLERSRLNVSAVLEHRQPLAEECAEGRSKGRYQPEGVEYDQEAGRPVHQEADQLGELGPLNPPRPDRDQDRVMQPCRTV